MYEASRFKASLELAQKTLPTPLLNAIIHVFHQQLNGVVLVGGTALAGFYAGHRRSDDIDLFVQSESSFKSAILAIESLSSIGANLKEMHHSRQYYNSICNFNGHSFTIDVVVDSNLFQIGTFQLIGNTHIANVETIYKMKAATLVSRCSEKDIYDLIWLFDNVDNNISNLVKYANDIDNGANLENILISLTGATLKLNACNFAIHESFEIAHKRITKFSEFLITELLSLIRQNKEAPLKDVLKKIKK
jgi:hypothetical protein